jgi:predicted YcjX-like family ATPase
MAGSPALTFAPVPKPTGGIRKTFWAEMKRRYDAYKTHVVRPFFRDHFSKIDRQIVLVDLLSALDNGPDAMSDLQRTMRDVVCAFRPGQNSFLTRLLSGQRVDKILFSATKADHLHHTQHGNYTNIMRAVMDDALRHAKFRGAQTAALSLASVRSTTEAIHEDHPCVRGTLLSNRKNTLSYAGSLTEDAQQLLRDITDGRSSWLGTEFTSTPFAPPVDAFHPDRGIAHIRLDHSLEFLLGDRV